MSQLWRQVHRLCERFALLSQTFRADLLVLLNAQRALLQPTSKHPRQRLPNIAARLVVGQNLRLEMDWRDVRLVAIG